MAAPTKLGWQAIKIVVVLSKPGGWNVDIEPVAGSPSPLYPDGTTVVMDIHPANQDTTLDYTDWTVIDSWAGSIADDIISFRIAADRAEAIPDKSLTTVVLTEPGIPPYAYMLGTVSRVDK
jgi:hypothetical protein